MSYVELAFLELTKTHDCYAQFEGVLNDESDFNKVKVRTNTLDTDGISYIYANNISLLGFTWEDVVNKSLKLEAIAPLKADIEQAKKLLAETDWVVVKIAELNLNGLDVSDQYLDILSHRKLMREVINAKETEIANV